MTAGRFALAFESTHAAMTANRALADHAPVMIPTPPALSAGCGMTLCFDAEGDEAARAVAESVPGLRGLAALYASEREAYRLVARL